MGDPYDAIIDDFSAFPADQAIQLQAAVAQRVAEAERDRKWTVRRVFAALIIVGVVFMVGVAGALYRMQEQRHDAQCDLAQVISIAIPPGPVPGRTPAQDENIKKFYKALAARGIYTQTSGC